MAHATFELIWISYLLCQFGIEFFESMHLWYDNRIATYIATNPIFHEWIKPKEVDCHFVRQKLSEGIVSLRNIRTGDQLANLFTKAFSRNHVDDIYNKLDMFDIYVLVWGVLDLLDN